MAGGLDTYRGREDGSARKCLAPRGDGVPGAFLVFFRWQPSLLAAAAWALLSTCVRAMWPHTHSPTRRIYLWLLATGGCLHWAVNSRRVLAVVVIASPFEENFNKRLCTFIDLYLWMCNEATTAFFSIRFYFVLCNVFEREMNQFSLLVLWSTSKCKKRWATTYRKTRSMVPVLSFFYIQDNQLTGVQKIIFAGVTF